MLAHAEVALRQCVDAVAGGQVDQKRDLYSPALDERHRLEQGSPPGVFARERLDEAGELGEQRAQGGAGDEFGHAAAAGRCPEERAAVVALDEPDRRIGEQGLEQVRHEVRAEVPDVGVQPADEVAAAHVERLPEHVALTGTGGQVGEDRRGGVDDGAFPGGDLGGGVGGAVVDDEDLVDEGDVLHQGAPDRGDRLPDGGLLVPGRDAHRDDGAGAALDRGEAGGEG